MTSIYYSDLFSINGKGCLVMGSGKSDVCRNCTGANTETIGLDSIRLELNDKKLLGYYDAGMGMIKIEKSKMPNCEIHYLIYMLSNKETTDDQVKEISKEKLITLSNFNITFDVKNSELRLKEFEELISNSNVICITVPWCQTREEKGQLISKFIK